jgi:crotonobetainyl-CoA:carnitine CoA-transferase CaiB-like acyl-CoA transferase
MTHRSHDLVAHRVGGEPVPRMLTGGSPATESTRARTGATSRSGALEPKFFRRLCEILERPELAERQYEEDQDGLATELEAVFRTRDLTAWLDRFGDEDVCVGPVWTREEAADVFGSGERPAYVPLGAHTLLWRSELGVDEP